MKPISSFFSLIPLAFCLSLLPHVIVAQQTNSSNQIATACQHSSHKEVCIASLESDPTSHQADLPGLAFIALKLASSNASDTVAHIGALLQGANLDPIVEQGLTDCSEHYLDAIDQIDNSVAALTAKAYNDVSTSVKVAIIDAAACEAAFKQQPGQVLTLARRNRVFRQLCNNALTINKLLV